MTVMEEVERVTLPWASLLPCTTRKLPSSPPSLPMSSPSMALNTCVPPGGQTATARAAPPLSRLVVISLSLRVMTILTGAVHLKTRTHLFVNQGLIVGCGGISAPLSTTLTASPG